MNGGISKPHGTLGWQGTTNQSWSILENEKLN
jgi:hypothetical protein